MNLETKIPNETRQQRAKAAFEAATLGNVVDEKGSSFERAKSPTFKDYLS